MDGIMQLIQVPEAARLMVCSYGYSRGEDKSEPAGTSQTTFRIHTCDVYVKHTRLKHFNTDAYEGNKPYTYIDASRHGV